MVRDPLTLAFDSFLAALHPAQDEWTLGLHDSQQAAVDLAERSAHDGVVSSHTLLLFPVPRVDHR